MLLKIQIKFEIDSKCRFWILAFSTNFWAIKIDLPGNTVLPQAFVDSKCKRSSLRSQWDFSCDFQTLCKIENDAFRVVCKHGVWKSKKKSHSTLRADRATFTLWVDKSSSKMSNLASFWKPEVWCQTVLPDRSLLKRQKLVENAKMSNFKWDILSRYPMWGKVSLENLTFCDQK